MVRDAESMYRAVRRYGIIPFFENPVPGYSIEELTPPEFWFEGDELGPWDWKIDVLRRGDIVYGKFLCGGKAAFATPQWYRELRCYRQAQARYAIENDAQQAVMDRLSEKGSITIREVRELLGVKKAAADALMTRLQMQCRVVTGDIQRVYRGPDLHYNGWQVSSFCRPEDLFGGELPGADTPASSPAVPFGGIVPAALLEDSAAMVSSHTPDEALSALTGHIAALTGSTPNTIAKRILNV